MLRDELEEAVEWQAALIQSKALQYKGRSRLITDFQRKLNMSKSGVTLVHGELGTGKTSFMVRSVAVLVVWLKY